MKDLACIAIGINQYKFLEPLSYAEQDAEALYTLLIEEAGFAPDRCSLCTEKGPQNQGQATYPSRDNILNLIESLSQNKIQGGDGLWCFFSGYGFNYKGEDYLMPIDGLMSEVEATGISVKTLMERLKKAPTKRFLLLLDINGSQNPTIDERIGINTVELAREMEIPMILSYNSSQLARETSALRHGFFTAALLEGLGSGDCTTLESLEIFLSDRLNELRDRHLRPEQKPLIVVNPSEKTDSVIMAANPRLNGVASVHKADIIASNKASTMLNPSGTDKVSEPNREVLAPSMTDEQQDKNDIRFETNKLSTIEKQTMSQNTTQPVGSDKSFLQKLILTSCGVAVVLLAGVIMTNKSVLLGQQTEGESLSADPGSTPTPAIPFDENSAFNTATEEVSSLTQRQDPSLSTDSQILLSEARTSLGGISASSFSEAIAKASEIKPNDPLFVEAQQEIERWSWTILDIGNGRAQQENYNGAIAAARLVPDFAPVYENAQQDIAEWEPLAQQLKVNQALLAAAKALIEPGQASSYNKAIDKARDVLPDMPGYEEARQLIANWSDTIFNIALLRAERGNFSEAIRAAELVPAATPTYETAQKAIADWKIKQRTQEKT
ncbi:MAG: caspase family protein [Cyanobacteriota bacterium]|nr:caspase family protein [Cyanobacteriota bacterium]